MTLLEEFDAILDGETRSNRSLVSSRLSRTKTETAPAERKVALVSMKALSSKDKEKKSSVLASETEKQRRVVLICSKKINRKK